MAYFLSDGRRRLALAAVLFLGPCAFGLPPSDAAAISVRVADSLKITVLDPTGKPLAGAAVVVTGENLATPLRATTDGRGVAAFSDLPPGAYQVTIGVPGFKDAVESVDVREGGSVERKFTLDLAPTEQTVVVTGAAKVVDPVYAKARAAQPDNVPATNVENLRIVQDVGTFTLTKGKLYLLPGAAPERAMRALFVGTGKLTVTPATYIERKYLLALTKAETYEEDFTQVYFMVSDDTLEKLKKTLAFAPEAVAGIKSTLEDQRTLLRKTLPERGLGFFRGNDNFDALELAAVYWPKMPAYFHAFVTGVKNKSLWFAVDRNGSLPGMGPEEVALMNYDDVNFALLYHAHLADDYKNGGFSSSESHNLIDIERYKIESVVDKDVLRSAATITFKGLATGPRVVAFGLEPRLRVSKVTDAKGEPMAFIQESEKLDGSLNVVFPTPLTAGQTETITISYEGKGVVRDTGGGNFFVGLRTSWYPSYGAFNDYALYDLTFKCPKRYTLVATGKPMGETMEGEYRVTTWTSPQPLVVAGFNYAEFKKKGKTEAGVDIEAYATESIPDALKQQFAVQDIRAGGGGTGGGTPSPDGTGGGGGGLPIDSSAVGVLTPTRLADNALIETQNAVKLYTAYFGEYPYGRIAISQQPAPNFGQAWPMLVYLPITSFFDKTQLRELTRSNRFGKFIDIVGPHEMAHQWWGHIVVWSSYHDQWLSEGFADFSAALYLEKVNGMKRALEFWENERETVVQKNRYGLSPADVGPLWMGQRLSFGQKYGDLYRRTAYPKGAYVLYMLRRMMWDAKTGDERFIAMMKEFTRTYRFQRASTEDFKAIAEKHITKEMDLQGNGKLDWFFVNWVYGPEIPEYDFKCTLADAGNNQVKVTGSLTQSKVSDDFGMLVPLYAEFETDQFVLIGRLRIVGNSTVPLDVTLPMSKKPKRFLINAYKDVLCTVK